MTSSLEQRQIERNIRLHDRLATKYERIHGEIFNPVEQDRLRDALARAIAGISTGADPVRALDFGCGSGNLTRHLRGLGAHVVAADVSQGFLDLIESRYRGQPVRTYRIEGPVLSGLPDASFDLVATYSVLHHIPDYVAAVREMGRLTKPGGIVFIDHEQSPAYWRGDPVYREFVARALRTDWGKFLVPGNYYGKLRRLFDPKYSNEGDIHVWPDDHIEWDRIEAALGSDGFQPLFTEDYLACRSLYRPELFEAYRSRCSDMRVMALQKAR